MNGWVKTPLGREVGLGPSDIELDEDSALPPQKGGRAPHFRPMSIVQTAGWIKMPLGTKAGLGPGHIVLHGDLASPIMDTTFQFSAHVYCVQTVARLSYC